MNRKVKMYFDAHVSKDSIGVYLFEFDDNNKRKVAKISGIEWIDCPSGFFANPTIELYNTDFPYFLSSLIDFMVSRGYFGKDEKELKRVENHLEDMRKIYFKYLDKA